MKKNKLSKSEKGINTSLKMQRYPVAFHGRVYLEVFFPLKVKRFLFVCVLSLSPNKSLILSFKAVKYLVICSFDLAIRTTEVLYFDIPLYWLSSNCITNASSNIGIHDTR